MFQDQADQATTISQIRDFIELVTPPAIVQYVDQNDESISLAFRRGVTTIEDLARDFQDFATRAGLFDFFDSSPTPANAEMNRAQARWMLHDIAEKLDDPALRAHYTRQGISERELIGVLRYATSEQRVDVLKAVLSGLSQDPSSAEFAREKGDNMCRFMSATERIVAARLLLEDSKALSAEAVAIILQSSSDLHELMEIIGGLGMERLLALNNADIQECVAISLLMPRLDMRPARAAASAGTELETLARAVDALRFAMEECLETVRAVQELCPSQTGAQLEETFLYNLHFFSERSGESSTPEQVSELISMMTLKMELECRYGIKLSHEEQGPRGDGAEWTERSLRDVARALEKLPEGLVLTTPRLYEIQVVDNLGPYVMGARFPTGVIRICECSIDHVMLALAYGGISSLEHTLVHEIGHGIQIGGTDTDFTDAGRRIAPGSIRTDFQEFMELSGWQVVDESKYEIRNMGLSVFIDGQEIPVEVPTRLNGQPVVLSIYGGRLFMRDALAEFSLVPYSRTSPWEDYAEAFAEYYLLPERLITFAPRKFEFFEQEYGRYADRADLLKLLGERLEVEQKAQK